MALTKLLSPEETAAALGTTRKNLATWRCTGRHGLPYVKVGGLVRYREDDVQAFIERHVVDRGTEVA